MTHAHTPRRAELMLLTATLFVTLCGLALTYFGKQATTPLPAQTVNINTVSAQDFAQALSVSPSVGRQIAAQRETERGHQFPSVYELRHWLAKQEIVTGPIDARFTARDAATVARGFWGGVLVFALAFLLAHVLMRKAAPLADPFLLPLTALLSGVGLMMVYSVKDPYRDTFVFTRQVWGIALWGLLALAVPLSRPFGRLTLRRYQYAYAVSSVLLMLLLIGAGHGPGGIHISVLGFEPIELIKILLVFFVVSYLSERRGTLGDATSRLPRLRDFAPLAIIYAFALLLFVLVRDLGPAVLLFGAFALLLYLTTGKAAYPVIGAGLLVIAAIIGYHLHFGFFATRVTMWLHPWDNPDPNGAQLADGLWGMATGGAAGSGLGLGDPGIMPRAGSDLIFASWGEETGLVGALCLLIVYAILVARGFRIALRAVTDFDRLLAAGLTTLLALQTMIITGGVTGLVPLTGITLPFVSFGASSLVADFFAVGVLLHLSAKTVPTGMADRPTPEWSRAARVIALGCGAYLLLGIGVARLMDVQGVRDTFLATRPLLTPDADQVSQGKLLANQTLRPHINPRLSAYAQAIPRGRILDRNGIVLAEDAAPDTPGATSLLTPDGRLRIYPGGPSCAHLVYAVESSPSDTDTLGRNEELRGFTSYADLLPDYRRRYGPFTPHLHGADITLTIDVNLQQAALDALRHYAGAIRDRRTGKPKDKGAAVLLNAATGEALAIVSLPTFNPDTLTTDEWTRLKSGADTQNTLLNRAVSGLYPPGSSFKIVTATAGLQHGLANTIVTCHHTDTNVVWRSDVDGKTYARRRITDEEGFVPHGPTDMAKALRVSCNVFFAHLGIDMGAKVLNETARANFGLSHMPSLALLGRDLPDSAYGQGEVQVTPVEMARVAQAVADNGQMLPVTFIKPDAHTSPTPTQAMTPQQASTLQTMLLAVTQPGGTAQGVFDSLNVAVAGKTGSAQNAHGDGQTHSWFVGFAPAQNPTLAFACIVENGGYGRAAAAPVCREILRKAL